MAAAAQIAPRTSLTLVGLGNRARESLRPSPERQAVSEQYAALSGLRPGRLARDLAANDGRTNLFESVVRQYGVRRVSRVVEWDPTSPVSLLRLGAGIVATWHAGATLTAIGPGFAKAGLSALFFVHGGSPEPVAGIEFTPAWDDPKAAMALARLRLASGGVVIVAIDGRRGSDTPPVTMLGVPTRFRRGAFALAHRTHAPIYPLAARWRRFRPVLTIALGPPQRLIAGDSDTAAAGLAAGLGHWLETFLMHSPERLRPGLSFTT